MNKANKTVDVDPKFVLTQIGCSNLLGFNYLFLMPTCGGIFLCDFSRTFLCYYIYAILLNRIKNILKSKLEFAESKMSTR